MRINADLSQRAVVASDALPWVASPLPGVERRMLERDGDEVARVTSLVRYAPNSHFSAHTHSGGEEFLVLEGTFSDDYGDFPAGTYVRNPVGSKHTPHTDGGCLILVKLWWMHPDDQEFVRVDTTREDLWRADRCARDRDDALASLRRRVRGAVSPRRGRRAAAARPAGRRGVLRPGRRLPRCQRQLRQGQLGAHADRRGAGAASATTAAGCTSSAAICCTRRRRRRLIEQDRRGARRGRSPSTAAPRRRASAGRGGTRRAPGAGPRRTRRSRPGSPWGRSRRSRSSGTGR